MPERAPSALLCSVLFAGCTSVGVVLDSSRTVDAGHDAGADATAIHAHHTLDGEVRPDGNDVAAPTPHSGSRIKVRVLTVDGGATTAASLWDSTRSVDCALGLARDGTTRCLPAAGLGVWYADSSCTTPVAVRERPDTCTSLPHYALETDVGRCPSPGTAVYAVGSAVAAPATPYMKSVFGCGPVPSVSPGSQYFEATASPATDWVVFEHAVQPVTSRLGVAYHDGTDGSRVVDGAWLLAQQLACGRATDASQVERCVPSNRLTVASTYFAGDGCRTPVGLTLDCGPPDLLMGPGATYTGPSCTYPTIDGTLYAATPVDPSAVFTTSAAGGTCAPTPYAGFRYYSPGAVARFEDYPIVETVHEGSGRIQQSYLTSEGKRLFATGLYDSQIGVGCTPAAEGNRTLCETSFPTTAQAPLGAYFADARCGTPVFNAAGYCGGEGQVVGVQSPAPPPVCGSAPVALFRRGAAHTGRVYSTLQGPCAPAPTSIGSQWYEVGAPVDAAEVFATLTEAELP
jgi:hypothetical protein